MKTFSTVDDFGTWRAAIHAEIGKVGFVPTMGALHEGHLSLIRELKHECEIVIVSIFVNPTQFNRKEDFVHYPRDLETDAQKLRHVGCDCLFIPDAQEIFPDNSRTVAENTEMSRHLCGAHRPGHFRGVLTVVLKLMNIVKPDLAAFGKKDYQQFLLIRRMISDFFLPIEIRGIDTIRENDGLAMSSRNRRLTQQQRESAARIPQGFGVVIELMEKGTLETAALESAYLEFLTEDPLIKPEYAEFRTAESLERLTDVQPEKHSAFFVCAWIGNIRLIDNFEIGV